MRDVEIGFDAITMVISEACFKNLQQKTEKRNKQNKLYLEVDKAKQKNTYNVTVILPSIIRPSNLQGFSLSDSVHLKYVIGTVEKELQEILGVRDLRKLVVKNIEINANKKVSIKVNIDIITAFVSRALIKENAQQIEYCHGLNSGETRTIKTKVLDGFKTARHSSGRYSSKFYRKDRQLGLENKIEPVFRMENIYNSKGVSQALRKKGIVTLIDLLKESAMHKLIQMYILDVRQSIMPPIRLYLEDATSLVLEDLKAGNGAYKTLLKRYDIIQYDFRIFRLAMKKYYKMAGKTKGCASVQISRIKAKAISEGIIINEGTIKELEEMFKKIQLQKV